MRGGFVCKEHATNKAWTLDVFDLGLLDDTKEFSHNGHLQLARKRYEIIRERLFKRWRANNPRVRKTAFELFYEDTWKYLSAMLTYQTSVSTSRVLMQTYN
jgi:hypothetical protein